MWRALLVAVLLTGCIEVPEPMRTLYEDTTYAPSDPSFQVTSLEWGPGVDPQTVWILFGTISVQGPPPGLPYYAVAVYAYRTRDDLLARQNDLAMVVFLRTGMIEPPSVETPYTGSADLLTASGDVFLKAHVNVTAQPASGWSAVWAYAPVRQDGDEEATEE